MVWSLIFEIEIFRNSSYDIIICKLLTSFNPKVFNENFTKMSDAIHSIIKQNQPKLQLSTFTLKVKAFINSPQVTLKIHYLQNKITHII